jgi:putative membrane protein
LVDALHTLSQADRQRVRAAVDAARKATSAKFDFVVVPASEHYALYPVVWSAVLSIVLTGALSLVRPHLTIGAGVMVTAALFVLLSFLLELWPVRMALAPRKVKRVMCSRMARHQFSAHLISRDTGHNGVMLFVSLAEHHLEIIAERDAHAAVPAGTWDRIVTDATAKVSGNLADGLVDSISVCGAVLSKAFPATAH